MRRYGSLVLIAAALLYLAPVVSADEGWATWYGPGFHGRTMANGQVYDQNDPTTTASNAYPFGTWLKVTNPANGKTVYVQVRDRGGFSHALDLSHAAFKALDDPAKMWLRIQYEVVPGPGASPTPAPKPAPSPTPARSEPTARSNRPEAAAQASASEHTVQAGETLWSIARRHGVSVEAIQQANGLGESEVIRVGQVLALKGAKAAPASGAGSTTREHVVVEGEVIGSIAERYGVSVEQIAQTNGLDDANLIRIGQKLVISSSGTPAKPAPNPKRQYVVEEGDTLFGIAMRHSLDPDDVARLNGLDDPNMIQPGQVVRLE